MLTLEISPDTRAIADRLVAVSVGSIITHAEISAVVSRDIRSRMYLLYSAFKLVQNEVGAVFGSVRGRGYQRLEMEQVPTVGHAARRRIRKASRKASKSIVAVLAKANDVPNSVRLRANTELSVLGLVEHVAKDRNVKPSEDMVERPQPVAMAAQSFLRHIGVLEKA